ncbi:MAG: AbrB/MazE/SpoVT family DNA-binding domain-containing protein [Acidobacteriota bacterium]
MELKIRKIGSSQGVLLPREILDRLRVVEGDSLSVSETPDGIQLSPYDPKFARAMEGFERVRRRYRDALRELAK